jgi:hypothetical protein
LNGAQPGNVTATLPLRHSRRAAVVSEHARQLLEDARLDDDTRVRISGALRACETMRAGATTLPNVSSRQILNAAARDVSNVWAKTYGMPPWKDRPLALRWLDR